MRRTILGGVAALILVAAMSAATAAAGPVHDHYQGSYTNTNFHDCGSFQVGFDLDYVSDLITTRTSILGRFDDRFVYWRSTDGATLGVEDLHQVGRYALDADGNITSYVLAGPATLRLVDGEVLRDRGVTAFAGDGTIVWQAGQHPDLMAALCRIGSALP